MVADLFSLLAQTASPKGKPGKGALRRGLPRRGKPRKGALRRTLLQRGKPRKERKSAESLERAKRGKGWCGGWSRPLQSACADSFPEGGSRERANCADSFPEGGSREKAYCAERFYREENRERNERQPWRWKGQSGERLVRRLEQTSSVCLRRQLPRRGSREGRNDSAACGHKNR